MQNTSHIPHTQSSRLSLEQEMEIKEEPNQSLNHQNHSSHNFTVAVRIKPKDHHEENVKIIINKNCKEMSIQTAKHMRNNYCGGKCKTFKMDSIYEEKSTNEIIFTKTVKEKLSLLKSNRNVALMAYGATNSGKTYTILGSGKTSHNKHEGLVHLTYRYLLEDLFQGFFKFYFSYLQIYNENVQDLLCDQEKRHNLNVFEDHSGKISIPQLTRIQVSNYSELCKLIQQGSTARAQSSNNINKLSSRSHAILQLEIFSVQDGDSQVTQAPIDANFMVIDLAGSEKSTPYFQQSQQVTLKQGSNINRSLLALGNCIKNLANGQSHIPYRNSKLTRLLKQNLSGSCHNIMIACISHTSMQFQQSISTLQYASKACRIELAEHMNRGRNRGKFVTIPCQHCKMSIDFTYLCKAFKQHAFQIVDQLAEPKAIPIIPKENRHASKQQKLIDSILARIRNLGRQTQKLDHLSKMLENIQNSDQKIQIHIQQTQDSTRQHQKLQDLQPKGLLKLKTKLNLNVDRGTQRLAIKSAVNEDPSKQRPSRSRSQKSVKLKLKEKQQKQKIKNIENQSSTSYIKIQQAPKSLNISSIRAQDSSMQTNHLDHYVQPFLPQLSFDISQFYQPKEKLMNGRIQKDFQGIQFIKQKRNSEPRNHCFNKQNSQFIANLAEIAQQGSKTYRDAKEEDFSKISNNTSRESKTLRRMKQDVLCYSKQQLFPIVPIDKDNSKQPNDKEIKGKIKLIARVR